ncbi:COP9 signalosome complex subunit 2 [Smittium culicis]|uniref:COP9 signalosome complex subunit 2 n=1 Tax=Smittium culicis TaxID=133412 RepID=A0A1R1YKP3_9FUNG|nr:COP9 signalosome complex subunit 2 [Smittium culicis]
MLKSTINNGNSGSLIKGNTLDSNKSSLLFEIYAIELEIYTALESNKDLERIYLNCLSIKTAVPHPKLMGLVRETGGKIYMKKSKRNYISRYSLIS